MGKIGIISGIGASAGARLYAELIAECQRRGAVNDWDFPEIVLHNMSSRGMNEKGIADANILKYDLAYSITMLSIIGCDRIIIACNTAHIFIKELQILCPRIINMVHIAARKASKKGKYGVVCSRSTKQLGLYGDADVVEYPNDTQQKNIDHIIGHVIAGRITEADRAEMKKIIASLFGRGAKSVIIGCTELPLVIEKGWRKNIIDAGYEAIKAVLPCF